MLRDRRGRQKTDVVHQNSLQDNIMFQLQRGHLALQDLHETPQPTTIRDLH